RLLPPPVATPFPSRRSSDLEQIAVGGAHPLALAPAEPDPALLVQARQVTGAVPDARTVGDLARRVGLLGPGVAGAHIGACHHEFADAAGVFELVRATLDLLP